MYYNKYKGDKYEEYVLEEILKDEFDEAWLTKDIPEEILLKTNLRNNINIRNYLNRDIGFDIMGIKDNEYYFIQCKNYNKTIYINDVGSFFFLLYSYDLKGIIYYNGDLSKNLYDLRTDKMEYRYLNMNNMILDLNLNSELNMNFEYRKYQEDAYNRLNDLDRCILSLPCGMGKSYVSYLLSRKYKNIVIIAPTRVLTEELLNRFYNYYKTERNPILLSMDGELDINKIIIKTHNIVAVTYKSIDILMKLIDKLEDVYYIFDEYHNLSLNNLENENDNIYKILNDKDNMILFMSATPIKHVYFKDMINYNYKWQDAIYNKYICDFNIIIPNKKELPERILNEFIDLFENNELNKDIIIQIYFFIKNIIYYKNSKSIIYLTNCDLIDKYKLIINNLSVFFGIKMGINDICYYTSKTKRKKILNNFIEGQYEYNILLNISILNEGIDIPDCDSIFITNYSDNMINTVQRMSRCNRITKKKYKCYIYLWTSELEVDKIYEHLEMDNLDFVRNKVKICNIENGNENNEKEIILNKTNYKDYLIKNIMPNDTCFKQLLNLYNPFNNDSPDLNIDLEDVVTILNTKKVCLKETLIRTYIINKDYKVLKIPNKIGSGGSNKETIIITTNCFKNLCMSSKGKNGMIIRNYLNEINKFIMKNYEKLIKNDT